MTSRVAVATIVSTTTGMVGGSAAELHRKSVSGAMSLPHLPSDDEGTSEDTTDLDRDDPEGRRIAAAVIRCHTARSLASDTEEPIYRGRMSQSRVSGAVPGDRYRNQNAYGGKQPITPGSDLSNNAEFIIVPCGSHSCPLDIPMDLTHPTSDLPELQINKEPSSPRPCKGLFWEELEGLKEENRLLRHESEIWRIKGTTEALKLQQQDFICCLLHTTAFGCHGAHVDDSINTIFTDACLETELAVETILDIPVALLRWDLAFSTTPSDTSVDARKASISTDRAKLNETNKGVSKNISADVLDGQHSRSPLECVVVAMSPAMSFITESRDVDATGLNWKSLFEESASVDLQNIQRVQAWLDGLEQLFDAKGRISKCTVAGSQANGPRDLLVWLRLATRGEPLQRSQILFTPFSLGEYSYVLVVHSGRLVAKYDVYGRACSLPARQRHCPTYKDERQRERLTEVSLRWDSYKVLKKIFHCASEILRLAYVIVEESDIFKSIRKDRSTSSELKPERIEAL